MPPAAALSSECETLPVTPAGSWAFAYRSFDQVLDYSGARRTTLRASQNIEKRYRVQALSANVSLLLRATCGVGIVKQNSATPTDRLGAFIARLLVCLGRAVRHWRAALARACYQQRARPVIEISVQHFRASTVRQVHFLIKARVLRTMSQEEFPALADAPEELRVLEGGCGPVAAWQVLKSFGVNVSSSQVLEACRFESAVGTYPIGLATALAKFGLRVSFFGDLDPDPKVIERELYGEAAMLGVTFGDAISLVDVDAMTSAGAKSIIFYQADNDEHSGHFTPMLGVYYGEVVAPNEGDGLSVAEMERRRQAPGILRQCVVAWPRSD